MKHVGPVRVDKKPTRPIVPIQTITSYGKKASSRLLDYESKQKEDRKKLVEKHEELHQKTMGALT